MDMSKVQIFLLHCNYKIKKKKKKLLSDQYWDVCVCVCVYNLLKILCLCNVNILYAYYSNYAKISYYNNKFVFHS